MGWWALLPLIVWPLTALGVWLERKLPADPLPDHSRPFCACSRGSQRLGMRL